MARERTLMADGPDITPDIEAPIVPEQAERIAQERARRAAETQPQTLPTEAQTEQPQPAEAQQREASETSQAYRNELLTQLNIARNFPQERDRIFDERYPKEEVNLPDGSKEVRRPTFDSLSPQDRQRITVEIDAQAIKNLQTNSQMGVESFDEVSAQVEFNPRTQEKIEVRTALGRRIVIMPKTDQGKIDRMREVLGRIEATKDADGGEVNRIPFQEITQVINAFREDKDPAKRDLAQKMYSELDTRTTFHSIYLQYQKAGDVAAIFGTLQQLRADQLEVLFKKVEGVAEAFNIYENQAEEFIRASSNVTRQNELRTRFAQDRRLIDSLPLKDETADKVAPVRIAERLWEMTGRRAMHDRLEVKDPAKDAKSQVEKGDVQFIGGSLTGGNFAERRILRLRDYMRTQVGIYNPQIQLLDGIDLKTNDFITNMVGDIENDQKKKFEDSYRREIDQYLREGGEEPEIYQRFQELYNRYFNEGFAEYNDKGELKLSDKSITKGNAQASRDKAIKRLAEIDAYNQTKYILGGELVNDQVVGGLSKVRKRVESSGQEYGEEWEGDWLVKWEEKNGKWAKRKVLLDAPDPDSAEIQPETAPQFITKIRWGEIDFGALGDNPMLGWSLYSVQMPDAVRPLVMSEKADSFLRKPTYDTLKAMNETLIYLTSGWKEAKTKLLQNLVVFQRTQQKKALGIPNISYVEGDEMIINAVRDIFITQDEKKKVDDALGKTGWLGFLGKRQLYLHLFNPLNFIVVAIWDAIKKGMSTK